MRASSQKQQQYPRLAPTKGEKSLSLRSLSHVMAAAARCCTVLGQALFGGKRNSVGLGIV